MMLNTGRVWAFAALAASTLAAPAKLVPRDVPSDVLQQLTLFSQYSAAAYCPTNLNSTGNSVTCSAGNCPEVQSATTKTIDEFNESESFGDVAGFIAEDSTNKLIVVSFRGTTEADTWVANLDFIATDVDLCSGCKAHNGFWKSWEVVADSISSKVKSAVEAYPDYTLVLTGHSFGAAVATLGATALRNAGYTLDLYTYGSPRVGNEDLAKYITDQGTSYRVTHTNDIVPKLPPDGLGFSHTSPEYWITSGNEVTTTTSNIKVVEGIGSKAGNAGSDGVSVEAHHWYIVQIDGCD